MADSTRPYRHLNHDNLWPGFSWDGLELGADGALRLMAVPRFDGIVPAAVSRLAPVQLPAGVAVDRNGTVFFSDPVSAVVYRIDACTGETEPAPCFGGQGSSPTRFSEPAGLLAGRHRDVLYVADAGNGRVQLFDLGTSALVEILTGFQHPTSLASDENGNLYVVDTGTRRVDRLLLSGDVEPSFWTAVHHSGRVRDPRAVACDAGSIYVLDGETRGVAIFDAHGALTGEIATGISGATALAVVGGVVYVGDPQHRSLAVFAEDRQGDYVRVGDAAGYEGPVAAVAGVDPGGLLVLPGGGIPPLRLVIAGSFRHEGWLWSGAIRIDEREHFWNRVHAYVERPADSHVQFFVHMGPIASPPPAITPATPVPAAWRALANDATDFFVTYDGGKAQALWIAARFNNDRHSTPVLSQIRVDFDQESYLPYLPAIYRERGCDDVLLRYVSLFESFFDEIEAQVGALPVLLDPAAAPSDVLPWLAGFLAFSLPEVWSEQQQRDAIAKAYERYGRRGTVAGLREALRIEAGVRVAIDEPLQAMGWWSMPAASTSCQCHSSDGWVDGGDAILGFNTVLASSEPQGAVVGATATLDRSQLISQDEYGMPLFDAAAYRFVVQLYPADIECAEKLEQVKAILDREKPAHTSYEVCAIAPGIRVGYQARLGVDTLLGSGLRPSRLGDGALVLGGQRRGQVGVRSQVGVSTQL